jgi:pimeloyl-ACP methyl ester carboxylesterase
MQTYDIRKYVEGFFHFTDLDEIHRDNMSSFLSWAMFGKESNLLNPKESEQLAEINAHLDDRYSELRNLKPGFNPKVSHCNFSLEPISYIHRPLFFYIAAGISESCFNLFFFRLRGYQSLEMDGLSYWIKQGSQNDSLPPLLIFHGISPGWSMYGMMIKYLDSHRTVILIDFDSIKIKSMKFYMPTINRFAATISKLLHRHQIKKVSLIGHSFGTILSGWLVNHIPENIAHVTLIDPVSLLLAFPDVAYSFLYKKPKTIWEWVIYLAASKEITVAYALHRNFCWHRNILWLEDVPEHIGVVVGIGSADEIADMKAVGEYVRLCSNQRKQKNARAEITCVEWPDYHHGQIMVSSQKLSHFLSVIKSSENLIE